MSIFVAGQKSALCFVTTFCFTAGRLEWLLSQSAKKNHVFPLFFNGNFDPVETMNMMM